MHFSYRRFAINLTHVFVLWTFYLPSEIFPVIILRAYFFRFVCRIFHQCRRLSTYTFRGAPYCTVLQFTFHHVRWRKNLIYQRKSLLFKTWFVRRNRNYISQADKYGEGQPIVQLGYPSSQTECSKITRPHPKAIVKPTVGIGFLHQQIKQTRKSSFQLELLEVMEIDGYSFGEKINEKKWKLKRDIPTGHIDLSPV